jgi:hypothetical protein
MRFAFRFFAVWLFCCGFTFCARGDVRVGAPRPLGENNGFIAGTHAHFESGELCFVHFPKTGNSARPQLWSATPDNSDAKNSAWSTRAFGEQSPYLLDILASQRAFSPDGKTIAFVSQRNGQSAIYVVPTNDFGRQERAQRIATQAQSPAWLDGSTLLFESTNPQRNGLFRVSAERKDSSNSEPQLLFSRGGESTVAPDGQTICVAAKNDAASDGENATQLYLLSADGSGARAIPQTTGARRPCFAPDGSAIFYDAPAPRAAHAGSTPGATRVLWTVPVSAAPPTAQLFFVRENEDGDAEIIGTVFSGEVGELQTQIEFWLGEETQFDSRPQFTLPVKNAPIHNAPLLAWPLPRGGTVQEWTLRLNAKDAAGQNTQSTLTFVWPPAQTSRPIPTVPTAPAPPPVAPIVATIQPVPIAAPITVTPVPAAPVPATPVPAAPVTPVFPTPAVTNVPAPGNAKPSRSSPAVADLPVPALPASPAATTEKLLPIPPPSKRPPRTESTPAPRAEVELPPVRRSQPQVQAKKTPSLKPAEKPAAAKTTGEKKSVPNSGGIPAQMKAGSSTSIEVTLRNTGTRSWSSTGESPVRLLIRWVRADSGIRYRWAIKWLRETVEPGQSTKVRFDLEAPTSPGRYILTYALVRLSPEIYDGKNYKPPSAKAADPRWPGEFGAVSYEIDVR